MALFRIVCVRGALSSAGSERHDCCGCQRERRGVAGVDPDGLLGRRQGPERPSFSPASFSGGVARRLATEFDRESLGEAPPQGPPTARPSDIEIAGLESDEEHAAPALVLDGLESGEEDADASAVGSTALVFWALPRAGTPRHVCVCVVNACRVTGQATQDKLKAMEQNLATLAKSFEEFSLRHQAPRRPQRMSSQRQNRRPTRRERHIHTLARHGRHLQLGATHRRRQSAHNA